MNERLASIGREIEEIRTKTQSSKFREKTARQCNVLEKDLIEAKARLSDANDSISEKEVMIHKALVRLHDAKVRYGEMVDQNTTCHCSNISDQEALRQVSGQRKALIEALEMLENRRNKLEAELQDVERTEAKTKALRQQTEAALQELIITKEGLAREIDFLYKSIEDENLKIGQVAFKQDASLADLKEADQSYRLAIKKLQDLTAVRDRIKADNDALRK